MNSDENVDIILYTVKDIKKIFGMGINQAYALMNSNCFPSFKINSKAYISKDSLIEWIQKNNGLNVIIK